ncbi:MAG: PAS domain S-box protein [Bacteroidales bacterium]|nr:PAS domain S-box protein [Bacteroidales bacterium]
MISDNNLTRFYLTAYDKSICTEVKRFLHENNKLVITIDKASLSDPEIRRKLVNTTYPWLMDFESFSHLSQNGSAEVLSHFPSILLLMEEKDTAVAAGLDLPENISFIHKPVHPDVLKLLLQYSSKRVNKRYDKSIDQEGFYRNLFLNSLQPKIILDPENFKIIDANNGAANIFKTSLDDLIGSSLDKLHPEELESIHDEIRKVVQGQNSYLKLKYTVDDEVLELEYFVNKISVGNKKLIYFNIHDITEKEKADQMFHEQHEMLRSTLESIDDLFFTLNKDGDFIEYYQPSDQSSLALSSDAFVGKNIYDVGFPLDVARKYLQTIERVIDQDKSEQIDYYLEAFGSRLWYSARISPRKNVYGVADGVTVLCRDITRQKRNEETLKRARDFYLTLLGDFPSMIWKTNTSKRADYFNKTWLEFTGNDLEKELQTDWVEKIHMADVGTFLSTLLNAYLKRESFQLEHRLKYKSGEYRWVINAGRPLYNLEGKFAGFIGSCYDITERMKAEETLNLQKSAMESALEGILILEDDNENYPVIYANKELANITGYSEKQILGKDFLHVIGCPVNMETRDDILSALKNKKPFKCEVECTNGSKKKSWRLLYMAPVKDTKSSSSHFVAVLSDITETKAVENTLRENNKQLQKTNEELDRFVYSTSHELRSPLMSILGLINLMEIEQNNNEPEHYFNMIRDTISRLDKIIHDIIDYSRNSRSDIVYENIDFKKFIEDAIQNQSHLENFEKVKFSVDVKNGVSFLSDKKRVEIIFNNLISNCVRFHNFEQEDPVVRVSVKTSPVNAIITIYDNGTGIHDKHIPKVYEMFYRATEKSTGSGIGLYIVKEILEKLRGKIKVKSEPNKGTTFIIELPNFSKNEPRLFQMNSVDAEYF